jgi:hypothetical protein
MMLEAILQEMTASTDGRKQKIAQWAASKEPTILKSLDIIYRHSSDEQLTRLSSAAAQTLEATYKPTYLPPRHLTDIRDAVTTYALGDRRKAADYLQRAFRAQPTLQEHPVMIDLAAALLDVSPEQAVPLMMGKDAARDFQVSKGARWWRKQEMAKLNINWRMVMVRLFLLLLVLTGIQMLSYALLRSPLATLDVQSDPTLALLNDWFISQDAIPRFLIQNSIIIAAALLVDLIIRVYIVHTAASIFGGQGELVYFAYRMIPIQAVWSVSIALGVVIITYVTLGSHTGLTGDIMAVLDAVMLWFSRLTNLVLLAGMIYLALFVWTARETYMIGWDTALIIVLGSLVITVIIALVIGVPLQALMPATPGGEMIPGDGLAF